MLLDNILQANQFEETVETCPGCENHCRVRCYRFRNGNHYYSGNNCERVYANRHVATQKGANMMQEKYHLLFHRPQGGEVGSIIPIGRERHHSLSVRRSDSATVGQREARSCSAAVKQLPTIGIPRALGIYENYPFWHTLFTLCGFRVVLSAASTNRLYEKGIRTIVADNICFPAKLMHGHVMDLIEKQVDRIFYPWVVFEQKEDAQAKNSFNCPIVSGYSDVLNSSINSAATAHIPLDAPAISFKEEPLLRQSLHDYLEPFGLSRETIDHAISQALQEQQRYLDTLERRALQILREAEQAGRMVILLAARPYHVDPLIQHRIAEAIADMGVDVITENVATHEGQGVYNELNALCQWAYPNRIFKAAYFVGKHTYPLLHMVELTSFGCGPDAFILDEVRQVLRRYHKNLTILKIDDVNNIGSLRLRVRSLIESTVGDTTTAGAERPSDDCPITALSDRASRCQTDIVSNVNQSFSAAVGQRSGQASPFFLGVDSGSTTTKLVLLNDCGEMVYSDYRYNRGNAFQTFYDALSTMREAIRHDIPIAGSCATGYGENLLKTAFNLDHGIVETMAHFLAAKHLCPQVSFVLDIGGQDMKAIFVENGSIQRIEINEACSSGCGSFLMTFAQQLGYTVEQFAEKALFAAHPYDLGTRCTVFMNSKVKQAMREGAAIEDIAAGFSYSVIKNCLYKVLKLQSVSELGEHIVVQGGTFKNHSVVRALEKLTGCQVTFTHCPELMGAYGAALYALLNS